MRFKRIEEFTRSVTKGLLSTQQATITRPGDRKPLEQVRGKRADQGWRGSNWALAQSLRCPSRAYAAASVCDSPCGLRRRRTGRSPPRAIESTLGIAAHQCDA